MTIKPSYQITSHPPGSLKEIWTLSWPLILGFLSNGMMVFVDRIMLGQYSIQAMNASATAGSSAFAFLILPMVVAGISEVFVGRFNGQGNFNQTGSAVWQMIWFSILMTPIFILISKVAPSFLFRNTQSPLLNAEYFVWITAFGAFFCLTKALLGFYIGQGKVKIIAFTVLLANVSNIGLDYLLIFGSPISPSFGVKGAAIATLSTEAMMALILFLVFIKRKNRKSNGTGLFKLNSNLFFKSLKIGLPASLAHLSEYVTYSIFICWVNALGEDYLTITVILQTFYLLFFFIIEGVSKGITAVVSNLIGANKSSMISKAVKSTFKLHLIFVASVTLFLVFFSPGIFSVFINKSDRGYFSDPLFLSTLYKASLYLCVFYLFDGMVWNFVGVLVAASDSKFIMIVGTLGPWLLSLLPIYIGIQYFSISVDQVYLYLVAYGFSFMMIYWMRYRKSPWQKKEVVKEEIENREPEELV